MTAFPGMGNYFRHDRMFCHRAGAILSSTPSTLGFKAQLVIGKLCLENSFEFFRARASMVPGRERQIVSEIAHIHPYGESLGNQPPDQV